MLTKSCCRSQTMQTLKQRFFTDLGQKQNVKFLYQANVTKQIGYKYQRHLFGTNQYFIVNIFPRGKSCLLKAQNSFDCWKNEEVQNSPIFRYSLHFTSNQHHFAMNRDFHFVFLWGKVWSFVLSQPDNGQILPRSNIDNRLQQVSIVKTSIGVDFFSPALSFSRALILYAGNLFNRFDMRLTEG